MARYVLIGGGEVGRGSSLYETANIDLEIVKMTSKEKPNFLFIGLASKFSDSYYDTMKSIYKKLGCECSYLKKKNMQNNPSIVRDKISNADIIYVGGGDTIKLIDELKQYGIDKLLRDVKGDVVIVGISAGAIMLSKNGFSDSLKLRGVSSEFCFVEGLGLVDVSICPHYNDFERRNNLIEEIRKNKRKVVCLENGVALKIIDDNIELVKGIFDAKGYLCYYKDNKFIEEEIR